MFVMPHFCDITNYGYFAWDMILSLVKSAVFAYVFLGREGLEISQYCHAELDSASPPLVTMQYKVEIPKQVRDDNKK